MKYKASKVKHMKENAQQAAQARAEKEERKRFLAQQKEMMRQRSSELLALQHKKTPMELERIANVKLVEVPVPDVALDPLLCR